MIVSRALRSAAVSACFAELLDGLRKFVDAFIFGGHRANDSRDASRRVGRQMEHRLQFCSTRSAPSRSDLFTTKMSRDFHQPGLHILHVVAKARNHHDERAIREAHDVDFVLADADRLDQDDVLARCIEQQRNIGRGARQAAEKSARRHRANENSFVAGVRPACECDRRESRRP